MSRTSVDAEISRKPSGETAAADSEAPNRNDPHRPKVKAEGEQEGEEVGPSVEAASSVVFYFIVSISMVLLNKLVTSKQGHGFNFPMMLVFFQNFSATVAVVIAKQVGGVEYPGLKVAYVKRWLPLTFIFTGMLVTSLLSLRTMSVAVVTLLKSFAIICTALGDHLLFGHPLTYMMVFAFALMYVGSCLGGGTDAWITTEGLIFSLLNVACTSGYQLYMKGLLDDVKKDLGRWGPVFYNNLLSLPILVGPTLLTMTGENGWLASFGRLTDWAKCWILIMCILSPFMTMSTFWCISATSPTTYAVVGGMNKIPLAFFGMVLFNQWPTLAGLIGVVIGLSAGFVYTWALQRTRRDHTVTKGDLAKVAGLLIMVSMVLMYGMRRLGTASGPNVRDLFYQYLSRTPP
eukprot:Hpha_TRINITY_DN16110_c0_g2::TRINITY_DN16110_c0_g2_i1::g.5012::m.5012/K15356/VRG4, GONST1; GDP-mannose transporter